MALTQGGEFKVGWVEMIVPRLVCEAFLVTFNLRVWHVLRARLQLQLQMSCHTSDLVINMWHIYKTRHHQKKRKEKKR